jgi:hypothetical protein
MRRLVSVWFATFLLLCLAGGASALSVDPLEWSQGGNAGTLLFIEHSVGRPSEGIDLSGTTGGSDDALVFQIDVSAGALNDISFSIFLTSPTAGGHIPLSGDVAVDTVSGTTSKLFTFDGNEILDGETSERFYVAWSSLSVGQQIDVLIDTGTLVTYHLEVVPEPTTLVLIGSGLVGLAVCGRRRQRA